VIYLLYAIGALLAATFAVAALFFFACFLILRSVTMFVLELLYSRLPMQRAAKSNRG
jgi:hypothetical protein